MNKEKMVQKLKEKISDKRYEHSVGVSYTAACMAMVYGADVEAARTAGLLHDCAKGLSTKDKLEKARKYGLPVNKYEESHPEMLHAKLGAYYA
ncbi:MAG: HD domain-containing protein, partial [Lachnospiraceae bacterium]|nr:HD domain-containing protein [Lachnospiraceae bacterium]